MSTVRPLYRRTDVTTEPTEPTGRTQYWRGFNGQYGQYGFYGKYVSTPPPQGVPTDYQQQIKKRLPKAYSELFGRDDDHETDHRPREAAGHTSDRPGEPDLSG